MHGGIRWTIGLVSLLLVFLTITVVMAQGGLEVPWWTVDGGGGTLSGGPFTLSGTIGQADAGAMQGGAYWLTGGFWGPFAAPPVGWNLYLPLVVR